MRYATHDDVVELTALAKGFVDVHPICKGVAVPEVPCDRLSAT
jgi:hypothetical protein